MNVLDWVYLGDFVLRVGDRIHVKPFNGQYRIVGFTDGIMTITCNTWHGRTRGLPLTDFKCFVGDPWRKQVDDERKMEDNIFQDLEYLDVTARPR